MLAVLVAPGAAHRAAGAFVRRVEHPRASIRRRRLTLPPCRSSAGWPPVARAAGCPDAARTLRNQPGIRQVPARSARTRRRVSRWTTLDTRSPATTCPKSRHPCQHHAATPPPAGRVSEHRGRTRRHGRQVPRAGGTGRRLARARVPRRQTLHAGSGSSSTPTAATSPRVARKTPSKSSRAPRCSCSISGRPSTCCRLTADADSAKWPDHSRDPRHEHPSQTAPATKNCPKNPATRVADRSQPGSSVSLATLRRHGGFPQVLRTSAAVAPQRQRRCFPAVRSDPTPPAPGYAAPARTRPAGRRRTAKAQHSCCHPQIRG